MEVDEAAWWRTLWRVVCRDGTDGGPEAALQELDAWWGQHLLSQPCRPTSDPGRVAYPAGWTLGTRLWQVADVSRRHGACYDAPPASWLALSGGDLLSDRQYVHLLGWRAQEQPPLAARLWPELIDPLPFKLQLAILADLASTDVSDECIPHILATFATRDNMPSPGSHASSHAWSENRFLTNLLSELLDNLKIAAKEAAAGVLIFEGSALLRNLQLIEDLFIRNYDVKKVAFGLGDLKFLPNVSPLLALIRSLKKEKPNGILGETMRALSLDIQDLLARHRSSRQDVKLLSKKQVTYRLEELLGLKTGPVSESTESDLLPLLDTESGLSQLLQKAKQGSKAAVRLLVDRRCATSFGAERWLDEISQAKWLIPRVQIEDYVFELFTTLIRLHADSFAIDQQNQLDVGHKIRFIYRMYFRELPLHQQATARAYCYIYSRASSTNILKLNNSDDELHLLATQHFASGLTYLFDDPDIKSESESQLTLKLNRLVPEQLEDKNYLSSANEISMLIPHRFVERILAEALANPKQATHLCALLSCAGHLSRYRCSGDEDWSIAGSIIDGYIGDIKWKTSIESAQSFMALITQLTKSRPVASLEASPTSDERVTKSLHATRTAIYDVQELLASSVIPRIQQYASDGCDNCDHLEFLLDLLNHVLSEPQFTPVEHYFSRSCSQPLTDQEDRFMQERLWILETYPWELLLALCKLLDQRPLLRAATISHLDKAITHMSTFMYMCIVAAVKHPCLPGPQDYSKLGITTMRQFVNEVKECKIEVLLRLQPLFHVSRPYQATCLLPIPTSWLDPEFGFPRWIPKISAEEDWEEYARCLRYCSISDWHCSQFLERTRQTSALQNVDESGEEPPQQRLALAVMLAYSSTDESYRLANNLLPRLFQNQLLQFSLPATMPLSSTSIRNLVSQIAPDTPDLGDRLINHILSLHMLLRITISLMIPHGEEMAILYVGLESGQVDYIRKGIEAAKRYRDDLIWPGNFVRVIHNWVLEWEQASIGPLCFLLHALLVSVRLMCILTTGSAQKQVEILALDIAHRLGGSLVHPTFPPEARTSAIQIVGYCMHLLQGTQLPETNLPLQLTSLLRVLQHQDVSDNKTSEPS